MSAARGPERRASHSDSGEKYSRRKAFRPYLALAPTFLITIGILIPLFVAIFYSFTDLTLRRPEYDVVGFRNYVETFTSLSFWHATWVTARYAVLATIVEIVLGMWLALLLNHESAFSRFLRLVLIIPLMIAPVIGGIIWLLFTDPTAGILRIPFGWIGFRDFQWSADPDWALFFLIVVDVWIYTPFVAILVLAGLRSLPKSPYEAALIDGGSPWFVFRNLTLPMLTPVLLIALVFRMMTSLQEFGIIFATTKGGPADRTLSLTIASHDKAFLQDNLSGAIPMLLVLWFIIYVTCFILIGFWRKAQEAPSGAA